MSATLPPPLFAELAFAGRSNVGKSSLINSLAQRTKLARTSSTPGCTRGLNLFRLTLRGGAQLDFVDLPGYGFAQRSKTERAGWGPMIEGFLESRVGLRGVVLLIDVRRGIEEEEQQMLEYLAHIKRKAIVVATKIDRLPLSKRKTAVQTLAQAVGRQGNAVQRAHRRGARCPVAYDVQHVLDPARAHRSYERGQGRSSQG